MVFMQTAPMSKLSKWIVWTSDNTGEFVKANKVIVGKRFISFIEETETLEKTVKQYEIEKVQDYHIVE